MGRKRFSIAEAAAVARTLDIDFVDQPFNLDEFRRGMNVELEHGSRDPLTNVTNDDPIATGKIALAHLLEMPDYYSKLHEMEAGAGTAAG